MEIINFWPTLNSYNSQLRMIQVWFQSCLQIPWNDLSNAIEFARFRVRMSELCPLKVGQLAGSPSGNLRAFQSFHKSFLLRLYCCIRLIFGSFCPILKEKELGFLRVKKRRRREEGEEGEKKEEINKFPTRSSWIFVGGDPYQGM